MTPKQTSTAIQVWKNTLLQSFLLVVLIIAAPAASYAASTLTINGRGYGHGVGMSQYGAKGFAEQGWLYDQILQHYYSGAQLARLDKTSNVRVLLRSGGGTTTFSGATNVGDKTVNSRTTYNLLASGGGKFSLQTPAGKQIATISAPVKIRNTSNPVKLSGPTLSGKADGSYRGQIELRYGSLGGILVINEVSLDDYVRGVVALESPSSWPIESLKAQAVAARSYAVTSSVHGDGFNQYPDTRSQMYGGVLAETKTTDTAVQSTTNQVMSCNGKAMTTYFFSTSGGKTESVENVFGGKPFSCLKGVDDPFEKSPQSKWSVKLSLPAAQTKLGKLVRGQLREIKIVKRGVSPRVLKAQIIGSEGTTEVSGTTLRRLFGLKDTWMDFSITD